MTTFKFSVQGQPRALSPEMENAFLRIAQEALANCLRHAAAKEVQLELRFDDGATALVVNDNGKGFELAQARKSPGFGLFSMRDRSEQIGGQLLVDSEPGKGTRIEARVAAPKQPES